MTNSGFENPALPGGTYQYAPSGATWSFVALSGISRNNSAIASSNPPAPGGVQLGFLQQTCSISQPLTLTAGTYTFTMKAAQRAIVNPTYQLLRATLTPAAQITSTKQFVWTGNRIAEERDANNNVLRRFYPQGEQISGTSYYYTRDHLGSVRELVDSTNAIRARYDYDAWGNRTKLAGDLDSELGYTGHYFHASSSMNLAVYRAYDSMTGRWLSRDPLGEAGGTNLYAYVQNNPTNSFDPLGLDFIFLNNPGAAYSQGHAAGLVGNNVTGWTYYSKDGIINGKQIDTLRVFPNFQAFINDPVSRGYDRAIYYHTTEDQDLDMTIFGDGHLRDPYEFSGNNCGDFVADLAGAGGIEVPANTGFGTGVTRPNTQYNDLIRGKNGTPFRLH